MLNNILRWPDNSVNILSTQFMHYMNNATALLKLIYYLNLRIVNNIIDYLNKL